MSGVTFEHVTKRFGEVTAVDSMTLEIRDREFMVLLGPSGCGKSTALRMIAGLETVTDGELRIGETVVNDVEAKDRDIAMVFQNYALYPHMTVADNMGFALKIAGVPAAERRQRVEEAAKLLDLEQYLDRKPKALSGGQRQRLAIARALVRDPDVLVLDEATSSIDFATDAKIQATIREEFGSSMLLTVAHRLRTVIDYDRLIVLDKGELAEIDTPLNLIQKEGGIFRSMCLKSGTFAELEAAAKAKAESDLVQQ